MLRGSVLTSSFYHLFFDTPNLHTLFFSVSEVTKILSKNLRFDHHFSVRGILRNSDDASSSFEIARERENCSDLRDALTF